MRENPSTIPSSHSMTSTRGPRPSSLTFEGPEAVKIIIHYIPHRRPTVITRSIHGRALPSLPVESGVRGPRSGLELLDADRRTLFRRPFSPPGRVEIPGPNPMWVRLPPEYTEVRVVIVPRYPNAAHLVAYTGDREWLGHILKEGL
jgi:hypothetical protein